MTNFGTIISFCWNGRMEERLPALRRDYLDRGREGRVNRRVHRSMFDRRTRRVVAEEVVPLPVPRRADRAGNEPPAAVRADVAQDAFDAFGAERAFVAADPRLRGAGGQ